MSAEFVVVSFSLISAESSVDGGIGSMNARTPDKRHCNSSSESVIIICKQI